MSNKPVISVIIPAYNSEKTLERAVDSIGNDHRVEIIVVENGSTDQTTQIASELSQKDKRIKVVHSEKGVSNARNLGIAESKGTWVTFLDSDDCYSSEAIDVMLQYSRLDCDLISFGHYNGNKKVAQGISDSFYDKKSIDNIIIKMMSAPNIFMLSVSKMFQKRIIDKYGVKFDSNLSLAEDGDFVTSYVLNANSILVSSKCIYHYITNPNSTMNSFDKEMISKYMKAMIVTSHKLSNQPKSIRLAYGKYILNHLNFMMARSVFSFDNKDSFVGKVKIVKATCKRTIIRNALKTLHIGDLRNLRMLPPYLLKMNLYYAASFLFYLRGCRNKLITRKKHCVDIKEGAEELSLDEIKLVELDLLKMFDDLCESNHLYYTLCGGTLLGAIRHKGFIPWDDDIDVLMPRPDYERLINGYDIDYSNLPDYARIASWKNGLIEYPFIKLLDMRTVIDSKYVNDKSSNHIWIDIFPIDGNPSDPIKLNMLYRKSLLLRAILKIKMAKIGEGKNTIKKIIKPILKVVFVPISTKKLCYCIDKNAKKYSFSGCDDIGGVVWGYGKQELISKQKYMKSIKGEFENHFFNIPSNYDEYLSNLYGEYMKMPPVEKRVTHDMKAYCIVENNKRTRCVDEYGK